jgi:hypothetical protein
MKTKFLSALMFASFLVTMLPDARSAVLIVDNSSVSPGVFTSINAAVTAASNGDTIYLQPTGLQYTTATISKPVHIIGPGHALPWTTTLPEVASITVQAAASGTILEGIVIDGTLTLSFNTTDVTVRYCRFSGASSRITTGSNCHNLLVEGNVFQNYTSVFDFIALNNNSQNVLIKNNFFRLNSTGGSVSVLKNTNTSLSSTKTPSSSSTREGCIVVHAIRIP